MTDVFISYSRNDAGRAKTMAGELMRRGLDVWWDTHLKTGAGFRAEIESKLQDAKAVIVIWSEDSVGSRFVCDEADVGAQQDTLFPVLVDLVDIPLGFRQIQTADLTKWRGRAGDRQFQAFLDVIESVCGGHKAIGGSVANVRPDETPQEAPAPGVKKVSKPKKPRKTKASRSLMMTGQKARMTLIFRSLVLAVLVAGSFGLLASVTNFVLPEYRNYLIGGLGVLVFITRYLTFQADRKSGGASLRLLSRSYLSLFFFALIATSPFLLEGRLYAAMMEAVRMQGIEGADINGVSFNAASSRLLTSSDDGSVRVWDAKTGVQTAMFAEHSDWVWSADFSPDGSRVVSASKDGTARVWDASSGREVFQLRGHKSTVRAALYDTKGRFIATASHDKTIILWDPVSGKAQKTLTGHTDRITALALSNDGDLLASASFDGTVRLWRTSTGQMVGQLSARNGKLNDVAFSRRATRVAAVSDTGAVFVWDVASKRRTTAFADKAELFAVEFVNGGEKLATGGKDGLIRIWDQSSGRLLQEFKGHVSAVRTLDVSGDGSIIVSGSRDNTARLWSVASGKEVQIMGHVTPAFVFPIVLDQPPVFMASRAPLPVDLRNEQGLAASYAMKGLAVAFILLFAGLVLRLIFNLVRQNRLARWTVVGALGIVSFYVLALMLSAFPAEASFLWLTLAFVPMTLLAFGRWIMTATLRGRL